MNKAVRHITSETKILLKEMTRTRQCFVYVNFSCLLHYRNIDDTVAFWLHFAFKEEMANFGILSLTINFAIMICSKNYFLFLLLSLFSFGALSQGGINNRWHFGNFAGLDFTNGAPTANTDGALTTNEGCATMCDEAGNILFYTDGISVWNANHQTMTNTMANSVGGTLMGDPSSTQSALIVPVPDHPEHYYIFTTDGNIGSQGLCYSILNMNLDSGLGNISATQKNNLLFTPTTEKLTAVQHSNNQNYWIITHPWNTGDFYVYLLTSNGLNPTPVISTTGSFASGSSTVARGYLKASSEGNLLAAAMEGLDQYELFHFNNTTGQLSSYLTTPATYPDAYGVEFSPDGSKLYTTVRWANAVYQWDLSSGNTSTILSSVSQIGTLSTTYGGALQVGPDHRIYLARGGQMYVSVINYPNLDSASCNFVEQGVILAGKTCREGLPNCISSSLFNINFNTENFCFGDTCKFKVINPYLVDSVLWNFDDPQTGISNYSNSLESTHIYSSTGIFHPILISYDNGEVDTLLKTVEIIDLPVFELGNDTILCEGELIELYVDSFDVNYLWSTGNTMTTIDVQSTGLYSVSLSNACGTVSDSVAVTFNPVPLIDLGPDTLSNPIGNPVVLSESVSGTYLWSTGDTANSITIMNAGNYHLYVTENGCTGSDSIYIYFYVGIDEISENTNTTIYPNPAKHYLYIHSNERIESIRIFSSKGRQVLTSTSRLQNNRINLQGLSAGVYYAKTTTISGKVECKRFVVQP